MSIFASAGATLDIGNPLSSKHDPFVLADFNGQSWVNCSWLNTLGAFGDQSAEITFDMLSENRTLKLKGTRNAGTLELVFAADSEDDGQYALRLAEQEVFDYAFRVTFNDAPSTGAQQPSRRYFIAKVMQAREVVDTANNVVRLNVTLGINSNIVYDDAH